MSAIVVFRSGHAVPVSSLGPVMPYFKVRRSVDLIIRGCSQVPEGEPIVALSTVTEIDSEHQAVLDPTAVGKKGEKTVVIVGRTRGAYRLSETVDDLINSAPFAALENEVREEAMKLIRFLSKWQGKYVAAINAPADAVVPATPVVAGDDAAKERDPHYCERRFFKNAGKLVALMEEHGVQEDAVSDEASGIFELLDLCAEKGIAVDDVESMSAAVADLPIAELISPKTSTIELPSLGEMRAAVDHDDDVLEQAKVA